MESIERKQKKQRHHDEDTPLKRKKLAKEHESSLEEEETPLNKKKKKKLSKEPIEESSTPIAESSAKKRSKKHGEGTPSKGKKLTKEHEASQEEDPPSKKKKQKLMKESIEEISTPIEEISAANKREKQRLPKEKSSEKKLAMKEKQKEKQKKRKKRLKEKLGSTVNEKVRRPEEDPQSDVSAREKRQDTAMNVSFRLLVPSKDLGKVIGEHGSRVQLLREQTGAHIKIGDAIMNLDERVIWISSKEDSLESQSAAERALLRVVTLLVEPENEDQETAKTRLLIAGSQAGSVVGKDGVAIDKLKKNTGAIVQVLTKERFPLLALASETDRLVQLEGKVSQVLKALGLIAVKLRKSPPRNGRKGSTKGGAFKSSVQIRIPNNLIGKLIGKEGATIRQIRQQCGVSVEVDELKDGAQDRTVHIKGALSQVTMAQTHLQVFLASKKRGRND